MCMQCVGAVGTAFQAATLVGGPIVVKHYQRIRAAFGLEDNSVAAVEARESGAAVTPPAAGEQHAGPSPEERLPRARAARELPSRAALACR